MNDTIFELKITWVKTSRSQNKVYVHSSVPCSKCLFVLLCDLDFFPFLLAHEDERNQSWMELRNRPDAPLTLPCKSKEVSFIRPSGHSRIYLKPFLQNWDATGFPFFGYPLIFYWIFFPFTVLARSKNIKPAKAVFPKTLQIASRSLSSRRPIS